LLEIGDYQMTFNDLSPIIRELRTRLICIQQGKTHDNYTWVTSMGI